MTDVLVAGGGLAGLVAARHLAEDGLDVTVFERESTVGGRVHTHREDGFIYDQGFQVVFDSYPAVERELDVDALDLRRFAPGATLARPGERSVIADPLRNPRTATQTVFNREITLGDKLHILRLRRELAGREEADIFDPAGPDRTIEAALADRGFSRAFGQRFVAPFYGGITLDRSLSTDARIFEYTFARLADGSAAVPADGMAAIPEQLARRAREAGARIETGATVESIETAGAGEAATTGEEVSVTVDGETITAGSVVVATDPETAADLTGVETPTEYRGCTTVYASLPSGTPLDTGKRLLLNVEDDRPNHVAPMSAVAPEYAPDGQQLLAATFLGVPAADDETLFEETKDTLSRWYPERSFADLEHRQTDRVPFAQIDQPPGFQSGLPDPDDPDGPVVLAGDYTRWSSIQSALESGRIAADRVTDAS
ncbi:protoporphyrinogen oxidase protein [Halorhabdus tiamatea SARL4B]|uniref:Protoporphyrinogen oxidase protein n=1 Tax=Halorhabdus tiamatea SARL4B TaxID=1033806 RepID=U2E547_9EURY|nr:NAD(P)/FAD-dependent oxidoreductase [Halorhabdus tiamatea]ERJ07041.1 protoporphyrinogen oxidase protein [Halorhabdus tiamatea SARL4B]